MKPYHLKSMILSAVLMIALLQHVTADELSLVYDVNGNLISGDGIYRVYNSFNQLYKVYNGSDESGLLIEELGYHPTEDRVLFKKVYDESGWIETIFYVSEEFVAINNSSGMFENTYIMHDGELVGKRSEGINYFLHNDHLGSLSVTTNSSGAALENTTFTPYGSVNSGGTSSRFDYTGKEYDDVLDHHDFDARQYISDWALFSTPDAIMSVYDPQRFNHYAYARGNPYKYVDPDGKDLVIINDPDRAQVFDGVSFGHSYAFIGNNDDGWVKVELFKQAVGEARIVIEGTGNQDRLRSFDVDLDRENVFWYETDVYDDLAMIAKAEKLDKEEADRGYLAGVYDSETFVVQVATAGNVPYGRLHPAPKVNFWLNYFSVKLSGNTKLKDGKTLIRDSQGGWREWQYGTIRGVPWVNDETPSDSEVGGGWTVK